MVLPLEQVDSEENSTNNSAIIPNIQGRSAPTNREKEGGSVVNKKLIGERLNRGNSNSFRTSTRDKGSNHAASIHKNNNNQNTSVGSHNLMSDTKLVITSVMNARAAKKEEEAAKEEKISAFKDEIGQRYALTANNEMILRLEDLLKKGPDLARKREMLGGLYYYGTLGVVIIKDVFDVFLEYMEGLFTALIVTIPLGVVIWLLGVVSSFTVFLFVTFYNKVNGVTFDIKQFGIMQLLKRPGVAAMCESIPFFGGLPFGTVSFILGRVLTNKERRKEEKDEQEMLDKFHIVEIEFLKKQLELSGYNSRPFLPQRKEGIKSTNPTKKSEPANKNQWKDMVEGSNQNITKSGIMHTINGKTDFIKNSSNQLLKRKEVGNRNQWKDMVDNSNQNITKPNNQPEK